MAKIQAIKLILAPKSNKALSTDKAHMVTGILKLLVSVDFKGKHY